LPKKPVIAGFMLHIDVLVAFGNSTLGFTVAEEWECTDKVGALDSQVVLMACS